MIVFTNIPEHTQITLFDKMNMLEKNTDLAHSILFNLRDEYAGKTIFAGTAQLRVLAPITRCAATQVNPPTAERDLNVTKALQQGFDHIHMGVYAEVIQGGEVNLGDIVG